jgi:hypothetical protein
MDLYGTNSAAISLGNAQRQQVRDLNERIRQHNSDIADKFASLKSQESSADTLAQLKETGTALWSGKGMPDKIKAYQDWRTKQAAKSSNPVDEAEATQSEGTELSDTQSVSAPATESEVTSPPAETVEEGGLGRSVGEASESAAGDIGESLETATGGALKGALKTEGGEVAETLMSKGLGVAGKAAGGLFGAAQGGLDIYEDIKAGKIAGNNNWEKAGNVLQIGGAAADLVGMAFPPAALVGGILDLASGAVDEVGEKLDEDKQASDLQTQQDSETETPIATPQSQTVVTGRVQ